MFFLDGGSEVVFFWGGGRYDRWEVGRGFIFLGGSWVGVYGGYLSGGLGTLGGSF